jgi:hypothetical protein
MTDALAIRGLRDLLLWNRNWASKADATNGALAEGDNFLPLFGGGLFLGHGNKSPDRAAGALRSAT